MRRLGLIPFALILLAGCGGPEKAFIGKWTMEAPAATPGQTPQLTAQMAAFAQGNSIEFKPDKTFSWTMVGKPFAEGSVAVADKTATMKVTKVEGQDVASVKGADPEKLKITAVVSDDGKKITIQSKNGPTMSFDKAPAS